MSEIFEEKFVERGAIEFDESALRILAGRSIWEAGFEFSQQESG